MTAVAFFHFSQVVIRRLARAAEAYGIYSDPPPTPPTVTEEEADGSHDRGIGCPPFQAARRHVLNLCRLRHHNGPASEARLSSASHPERILLILLFLLLASSLP